MRDPKRPRQFTEEFRRQIVALAGSGKPRAEVMREHDLGKSTLDRRIRRVHACGSTAAADNRTPEQNRLIELERENVLARSFDGRAPRTRVAADLAYVRAGGSWCCVCLLVDLCNRETVGCSCGRRKDARLVEAACSNAAFPLAAIEVFRSDRGPEFCNGDADALLSAFGIERSASRPGNPCDNAVVESTNRVLERELVRGRAFPSEDRLRTELFDWVNRCNNCRLHSTLGCMTPAGFREAGLILS